MEIDRKMVLEYLRQQAIKGGKKRAKVLTKEQRKAIAKKAADTRWHRKEGGSQ